MGVSCVGGRDQLTGPGTRSAGPGRAEPVAGAWPGRADPVAGAWPGLAPRAAAAAQRIVTQWRDAPPEVRQRAEAAWEQAWRDPATPLAFLAAWEVARRSDRTAQWDVATRHPSPVVRDALICCVVEDLVNPVSYTAAQHARPRQALSTAFDHPSLPVPRPADR